MDLTERLLETITSYSEIHIQDIERILEIDDSKLASDIIGELINAGLYSPRFIVTCKTTGNQYIASSLKEVCDPCRICGGGPAEDIFYTTTVYFTKNA